MAAGHEVDDCDLYAENFQPVLTAGERRAYHSPTPDTASVVREIERLRRAEGLVFVFPTWWFGMPAILKGYIDRVWIPGVAFELKNGRTLPSHERLPVASRHRAFLIAALTKIRCTSGSCAAALMTAR